ncbi:MAG: hybrid sensor histidine kinase/response regulator [Sphingomonas bacterium]|uniref:hybrid sensor histidine kinase/response regulator n=1 Tax=Sphingomonas bacterium TaxID=1895847 RepID=UPI0026087A53|nr:PAS domain-containing sensor histidine kinase [Sphingomonas bacterium]MDB5708291.1 hybrid sensor histidine kinase/response regulator [Sphingomonas bacterium]
MAESGPAQRLNRYELLVQSVTDYAIYMIDPTGIVTSWNAGAQRFKGYLEQEIIGQHFSRFYMTEDREAGLPARALHIAEHEGRFEAEGWRVRKDGSRFWANVVIDPVRDANGTLIGFAKVTRDLTERRAAEEELRRSEERFRLLVQSITDYAIYMLDPTGKVTSWNPGAQRFKGYRTEEILGEHFSRFYTEEDRATGLPERALATAESEGKFEAEGWRLRQDGSRFWAHVIIDPVRDEGGTLVGFAKITRDLTERKQAQQRLELAQQAFFHSQKMDAIGKLTGGVAHDFNNLLAAVIGSLDLARRRLAEGGDVTRYIDNAMKAAERGATLTQRMLSFARKQELAMEAVDVPVLVRGMADLLQRTIGAGVAIETSFPLVLPLVHADPQQLELALLNLAVNARDAMPEGGRIVIDARAEQLTSEDGMPPRDYVALVVTDQGEGMDEATLAQAMEPFFTTKGIGKGTGLGLSMVHGFAEQCGGRLVLRSAPGEGTSAAIYLPVTDIALPLAREVWVEEVGRKMASLRILAVDDDTLVLTNTAGMLEDLGHTVLQAISGQDALRCLRRHAVDLVVTDFAMPRMTGVQLADAIKVEWPDLPVLLVTGYAETPADTAQHLPRLAKPFREDQLVRTIDDVMAANRRHAGAVVEAPAA